MSAARSQRALAKSVPFFKLEASYMVDAGATLPELVRDGHSLAASALGVLDAIQITDDPLFAVAHLLRQAVAVIGAADDLAEQLATALEGGFVLDAQGGAA